MVVYFSITIYTTEAVSMIAIQDLDGKQLFGKYKVNPADGDVSIEFFDEEEKDNTVMTMDLGEGIEVSSDEFKEFDFTLPANVFDNGLRLTVTAANGEVRSIDIPKAPVKCGGITTVKREVDLKKRIRAKLYGGVYDGCEDMGTVTPSEITTSSEDPVEFTATPNSGYEFVEWILEGSAKLYTDESTLTPTIKVITNGTANNGYVKAAFKVGPAVISVKSDNSTMGKVSTSELKIHPGENYKITATPNTSYTFKEWVLFGSAQLVSGKLTDSNIIIGSDGTNNPGTAIAYFSERETVITVAPTGTYKDGGIVSKSPLNVTITKSESVTATPKDGYLFDYWYLENCAFADDPTQKLNRSTNPTISIIGRIGSEKNTGRADAYFKVAPVTVTVTSDNTELGTVSPATVTLDPNSTTGNKATINATPASGYEIDHWEFSGSAKLADGSYATNAQIQITCDGTARPGTATAYFRKSSGTNKVKDGYRSDVYYEVVLIGSLWWMKEDLRTTGYNPNVSLSTKGALNEITSSTTSRPSSPYLPYYYHEGDAKYYYNVSAAFGYKDGTAAKAKDSGDITTPNSQVICPDGYRIPTKKEWDELFSNADNYAKLNAKATGYFNLQNGSFTNCSVINTTNKYYLTSTVYSGSKIYIASETTTKTVSAQNKYNAFAVRCVKDNK